MQAVNESQAPFRPDADSPKVRDGDGIHVGNSRLVAEQSDTSDDGGIHGSRSPTKTKRLRILAQKTKMKTKRLLKSEDGGSTIEEGEDEKDPIAGCLDGDPAFNTRKLYRKKRLSVGGTADKALGAIQSIATSVVHPKQALKSKATKTTAGQLSKVERPYLSRKADLDFLDAHDNLNHAESTRSSRQAKSDDERDVISKDLQGKIEEMEAHRQSLRAAWTTTRHVSRVRVVPKRNIDFSSNEIFISMDNNRKHFDWLKWLGYVIFHFPILTILVVERVHTENTFLYSRLQRTVYRRF